MKNTSPVKNTDPKALDKSNVGDAAVLLLDDGSTVSCTITDVYTNLARFEWKTGPGRTDFSYVWLKRAQWLDRVTLFPPMKLIFSIVCFLCPPLGWLNKSV